MRNIKSFKLFESNEDLQQNIEDLFQEYIDIGMNVSFVNKKNNEIFIQLEQKSRSHSLFNKDLYETIERLFDYIEVDGREIKILNAQIGMSYLEEYPEIFNKTNIVYKGDIFMEIKLSISDILTFSKYKIKYSKIDIVVK